jgi:hypothetical protein
MFPNVRLLAGALFASVVALCCGFGIFAAFRVNHEPLSRLPANTVALQLVSNEAAGPPPAWQAPISSRVETVSDLRSDGAGTGAPTLLPISRITIQQSSLRTMSSVRPEAEIDASHAPPRHEFQPLGLSAVAALSVPTMSAALSVSKQPLSSPIATQSAPASPAAATGTASAQQTSATQAQPAAKAKSDAKPDVLGKPAEPATAMPAIASVEPLPDSPSPTMQQADVTNTAPEAAVPEPKARPKLLGRQILRKQIRQALQRRRLIARRRIALSTTASNGAQSGYQNSTFPEPFFQSAPGAFQHQSTANRSTARKNSNAAAPPTSWASSE